MFGLRFLVKKHIYLTEFHFSFKYISNFSNLELQIYISKFAISLSFSDLQIEGKFRTNSSGPQHIFNDCKDYYRIDRGIRNRH